MRLSLDFRKLAIFLLIALCGCWGGNSGTNGLQSAQTEQIPGAAPSGLPSTSVTPGNDSVKPRVPTEADYVGAWAYPCAEAETQEYKALAKFTYVAGNHAAVRSVIRLYPADVGTESYILSTVYYSNMQVCEADRSILDTEVPTNAFYLIREVGSWKISGRDDFLGALTVENRRLSVTFTNFYGQPSSFCRAPASTQINHSFPLTGLLCDGVDRFDFRESFSRDLLSVREGRLYLGDHETVLTELPTALVDVGMDRVGALNANSLKPERIRVLQSNYGNRTDLGNQIESLCADHPRSCEIRVTDQLGPQTSHDKFSYPLYVQYQCVTDPKPRYAWLSEIYAGDTVVLSCAQ